MFDAVLNLVLVCIWSLFEFGIFASPRFIFIFLVGDLSIFVDNSFINKRLQLLPRLNKSHSKLFTKEINFTEWGVQPTSPLTWKGLAFLQELGLFLHVIYLCPLSLLHSFFAWICRRALVETITHLAFDQIQISTNHFGFETDESILSWDVRVKSERIVLILDVLSFDRLDFIDVPVTHVALLQHHRFLFVYFIDSVPIRLYVHLRI